MPTKSARRPSQSRDWLAVLIVAFFIGVIAFGIWSRFYADCSQIGWLPVQDLPSRCLTVVRR